VRTDEIAAEADQWLVYRDADGREAYRVPSQSESSRSYLVTLSNCDCPDFGRNGPPTAACDEAAEQRACKHMLAVRLHVGRYSLWVSRSPFTRPAIPLFAVRGIPFLAHLSIISGVLHGICHRR